MPKTLSATILFIVVATSTASELPSASKSFASADTKATPSFRREVVPLLGRLGCNGRACHGSFQGQGGFRLSLFGYDFKADHTALTGGEAPRVDRETPAESLMVQKPTLSVAHKGGKRMEKDGWQYRLLLRWIESGARNDASPAVRFERLTVTPADILFRAPGDKAALHVAAEWSNGMRQDVTELCRFRTNDESIATIDDDGVVTCVGKGDTHVVAFYDNGVAPVPVMLPVSELVGDRYPAVPTPTRIDELVVGKLRQCGVVPSALSTDAEFLRRISLDITGTLPAPEEVEAFLKDSSAGKRARKVDELLERPAYAAWWTTRLCDVTGNNGQFREGRFRQEFSRQWYAWIHRRVKENVGYDRIVEGIVLATSRRPGQTFEQFNEEMSSYFRKDAPADFAARETMPYYWARLTANLPAEKALSFGHAFLGVRLQCAQCHKHPFDQWTKEDFDRFAAFFQPVAYGTPPADRRAFVTLQDSFKDAAEAKKGDIMQAIFLSARDGKTVPWREVFIARPGENASAKNPASPAPKKSDSSAPVKKPDSAAQATKKPAQRRAPPPPDPRAKILGGEEVRLATLADPREALMKWLRRQDNPYFARAFVNRVWAAYFNVGIVDPPDDLSLANPASNAPLLDYLTREFVAHGYDMKWLHREIANSRTYQFAWQTNESNRLDTRNFSHAVPRRMPAEVAYDAVFQATGSTNTLAGWRDDVEQRATGLGAGVGARNRGRTNYALTVFGKPQDVSNCDCERSNDPSLLQTLFLFNDGEVLGLINRRDGWVAELANRLSPPPAKQPVRQPAPAAGKAPASGKQPARGQRVLERPATPAKQAPPRVTAEQLAKLVREAYLRTVSRPPGSKELARSERYLRESPNVVAGMRDLLWALINTDEFIVNH
jgi:hypothetical protein